MALLTRAVHNGVVPNTQKSGQNLKIYFSQTKRNPVVVQAYYFIMHPRLPGRHIGIDS